jgi:hypothetical protein
VDIGDGTRARPIYLNANLPEARKEELHKLLKGFVDYFAWDYTEMPGLGRDLVEHRLPIKPGFRPFKQPARNFSLEIIDKVKEEVDRLLQVRFIHPCMYVEWVSNVVPVEKKNTGKIRVCVYFWNLNRATTKDEYPMPVADVLINSPLGNKVINFLDGNTRYNHIFMAPEDKSKTAFRCPGFVGLFEWIVMTFGLKNAEATYQHAMNLIFHDLLGSMMEVYIDDIVIKLSGFEEHLANLQVALERMRKYGQQMNPLKCAFGVTTGKFLGFVVHEHDIQIDPKKVE